MTPAEFEPLGLWMGWPRRELTCVNPVGWFIGGVWVHGKTSLTDAECAEAKRRLVAKGYQYVESYIGDREYYFSTYPFHMTAPIFSATGPTISAAVEEALLKLIAAERGKE